MGQYRNELTDLINLLDSGGFTADQGLAMTGAVDDSQAARVAARQAEQQAAQQAQQAQQQALLESLGATAVAGAQAGMPQDDLLQQLLVQQQFSGQELGPKKMDNLQGGLAALFGGQGAQSFLAPTPAMSEADLGTIQSQAASVSQGGEWDRSQFRDYMMEQLDPSRAQRPEFHEAVDTAWGPAPMPEAPPQAPGQESTSALEDILRSLNRSLPNPFGFLG